MLNSRYIIKNQTITRISNIKMHKFRELVSQQLYKETATRNFITSRMYRHLEKRSFATNSDWMVKKRLEKPIKGGEEKPHHTIRDKFTAYKIMFSRDYSGHNHNLLVDGTFQSEHYYLVVGAFTSTNKAIGGIIPIKVSDTLLNGVKKAQYFLHYPQSILIVREKVTDVNIELVNIDYKNFLASLPVPLKDIY